MRILVIGAFDFVNFDTGGQPVKTRELYYALQKKYKEENVDYFETGEWNKSPISHLIALIRKIRKSSCIIMLPARNGVKVISPLIVMFRRRNCRIFYDVVGGWLPQLLNKKKWLRTLLKRFNGIWVETDSMKENLMKQGFDNIHVVNNFKSLNILSQSELQDTYTAPYALCTFSRVMQEKGIEDAIGAVTYVNKEIGKTVFSLDIYGPVDEGYSDRFSEIIETLPDYIHYKGVAKPNESVGILKNYFALLFPTRFFTEGIPGTIIDAYSSGVPVITSLWQNHKNIFIDGKLGIGYKFGDSEALIQVLREISEKPDLLIKMKNNCLKKAEEYTPEAVMKDIERYIDGEQ